MTLYMIKKHEQLHYREEIAYDSLERVRMFQILYRLNCWVTSLGEIPPTRSFSREEIEEAAGLTARSFLNKAISFSFRRACSECGFSIDNNRDSIRGVTKYTYTKRKWAIDDRIQFLIVHLIQKEFVWSGWRCEGYQYQPENFSTIRDSDYWRAIENQEVL